MALFARVGEKSPRGKTVILTEIGCGGTPPAPALRCVVNYSARVAYLLAFVAWKPSPASATANFGAATGKRNSQGICGRKSYSRGGPARQVSGRTRKSKVCVVNSTRCGRIRWPHFGPSAASQAFSGRWYSVCGATRVHSTRGNCGPWSTLRNKLVSGVLVLARRRKDGKVALIAVVTHDLTHPPLLRQNLGP